MKTLNSTNSHLILSPIIDRFIKTNVYFYYVVYLFLIAIFLAYSILHVSWMHLISGLLGGIISWSLVEYLVHRYIFHLKIQSHFGQILIFILHGIHHHNPKDVSKSITPLAISIPLVVLFYFLFKFIFPFYYYPIYTGFLCGYVIYTIIHDSTHHLPMKFIFFKKLKRHHMRHHYLENSKNFGVSSPVWDYILGTYSKK